MLRVYCGSNCPNVAASSGRETLCTVPRGERHQDVFSCFVTSAASCCSLVRPMLQQWTSWNPLCLQGHLLTTALVILSLQTYLTEQLQEGQGLRHRLVGGNELPRQEYPFLAAFTFNKNLTDVPKPSVTCTGSLISQWWLVSAAHCLGKKANLNVKQCIEGAKCDRNKYNDFVFTPDKVKSFIRLGMSNFYEELTFTERFEIDYIVRPQKAYPSGGYGKYGGYDIILIKLKKPALNNAPACLPRPSFNDESIDAQVAGYGKYKRAPCIVGQHGPSKFRYCGIEDACRAKDTKFKKADCKVSFPYEGENYSGCQTKMLSPASLNKECNKFLDKNKAEYVNWPSIDEFEIFEENSLELIAKCYRQTDENKFGWCGVNMADSMSEPQFDISSDSGWGFCTEECYPEKSVPIYGVARSKDVQILTKDYCERILTKNATQTFKVKPKVLCVGLNKTYNSRVYIKSKNGDYYHIKKNKTLFEKLTDRENAWYIIGPGSCHGDSGGPLFKETMSDGEPRNVILGVTSSGTSKIGNCGGIHNPTQYTRLKRLLPWILKYVQDKQNLCFVGDPSKKTQKNKNLMKLIEDIKRKSKSFQESWESTENSSEDG